MCLVCNWLLEPLDWLFKQYWTCYSSYSFRLRLNLNLNPRLEEELVRAQALFDKVQHTRNFQPHLCMLTIMVVASHGQ